MNARDVPNLNVIFSEVQIICPRQIFVHLYSAAHEENIVLVHRKTLLIFLKGNV